MFDSRQHLAGLRLPPCYHRAVTFSDVIHGATCLRGGEELVCKHVQLLELQASNLRVQVETLCNDAFPQILRERANGDSRRPAYCHAATSRIKTQPGKVTEGASYQRFEPRRRMTTSELSFSSFDRNHVQDERKRSEAALQIHTSARVSCFLVTLTFQLVFSESVGWLCGLQVGVTLPGGSGQDWRLRWRVVACGTLLVGLAVWPGGFLLMDADSRSLGSSRDSPWCCCTPSSWLMAGATRRARTCVWVRGVNPAAGWLWTVTRRSGPGADSSFASCGGQFQPGILKGTLEKACMARMIWGGGSPSQLWWPNRWHTPHQLSLGVHWPHSSWRRLYGRQLGDHTMLPSPQFWECTSMDHRTVKFLQKGNLNKISLVP